jgi:peptide deformylase
VSILPIRILGDPVLREPCSDVVTFDRHLRTLCRDMLDTMYDAPGVGLAASQVGLSLRLFVFDAERGAGPGVVANPVLLDLAGEVVEEEGCLSIPSMWASTPRAERARVTGLDEHGRPVSLVGEGLLARIFQHETDHVNGMLFIDRLGEDERRQVMAALRDRDLAGGATRSIGSSSGSDRPAGLRP